MNNQKKTLQFSQKAVSCINELFVPKDYKDVLEMFINKLGILEEKATEIIDSMVKIGVFLESTTGARDQTAAYSESYTDPDNQRAMLLDWHRTDSYKQAIKAVVSPGDLVIDVGSGSGILSLFAASAGAKKVYSIEATPVIELEKKLIKINGLEEKIECLHTYANNVLLDSKVDILVSEWMGMFAMEEYMFDAVQTIRDNFLAEGGQIIPNSVKLFLAPIEDRNLYYRVGPGFWKSSFFEYDFNIDIKKDIKEDKFVRCTVPSESLIASPALLLNFDCTTDNTSAFHFTKKIEYFVERNAFLHGFCGYFDAILSEHVTLHTSPWHPATDWKQAYFPLEEINVKKGDVIQLTFVSSSGAMCPKIVLKGCIMRDNKIIDHFESKTFVDGASKYAHRAL